MTTKNRPTNKLPISRILIFIENKCNRATFVFVDEIATSLQKNKVKKHEFFIGRPVYRKTWRLPKKKVGGNSGFVDF